MAGLVATERSYNALLEAGKSEDSALFLEEIPLFKRLPKEALKELRSCCESQDFAAGEEVIKQGDEGSEFFIIKSGSAIVSVDGAKVSLLTRGDYFGEGALLQNDTRQATVTARTAIQTVKITRAEFQRQKLHEKLEFPKRQKVNKRHQMMAAQAGKTVNPNAMKLKSENSKLFGSTIPKTKKGYCETNWSALREIFSDKLAMSAFLLVPLAQTCKYLEMSSGIVFATNFFAIVPLASILGTATEAISVHTGQLIGGLLNATFGNAVEMIMCVQAVKCGLIRVVQGNLLGSILSNLLLVLGMAIFASGIVRKSQSFNAQGASANMSCQLVASISVCLPTVFATVSKSAAKAVLAVSRICSIFLMGVYGMFLYFMLKSHAELFADEGEGEESEEEEDQLSPLFSCILLALSTLVVFFCSECLVHSIEDVSETYGLSEEFIGVILLPIVGNAAEHVTAVSSAYKGMMDLALGVAVGSSTQISLFVVPCAVMFGWIFDQPMNLNFTIFDTACQMLTVFLVSQVLANGQTNWLHGAMLMTVYALIAVQTLFLDNASVE
eukprot:TRINITY_DN41527_c0_g1_i1.p1 TRINITY_DN41527_c0_g1~~TRINITY_DN41527_c0_g1_i1.p1  ORF type:complete len:570 (-),score=147.57 TRINITY_DN41527_c0_g1_i1:112-1773(-)